MPAARWLRLSVGVFGALALLVGIVGAIAGSGGYAPWRQFISELGGPRNPAAAWINNGFAIGGALIAAFLAGVARRENDGLRVAASIGAASAGCLVGVGFYPIHRGAAHVVAAGSCILLAAIAAIVLAVAARRRREQNPTAALAVLALVLFQWVAVFAACAYAAYHVATTELPAQRVFVAGEMVVGGVQPVALAEWTFFVTALALLGLVIAYEIASERARDIASERARDIASERARDIASERAREKGARKGATREPA